MQSKCDMKIFFISEITKAMERAQIIYLLLTFQFSSFEKTTLEFVGKHLKNQNLNQVSFYKRNSMTFAEKSNCQERKGFCEVSTRGRKMIF